MHTLTDPKVFLPPASIQLDSKLVLEACNNYVKDVYRHRRALIEQCIQKEMSLPTPPKKKWWQFADNQTPGPAKTWQEAYDRLESDGKYLSYLQIQLPSSIEKINSQYESERQFCLMIMMVIEENIKDFIQLLLIDYAVFAAYYEQQQKNVETQMAR